MHFTLTCRRVLSQMKSGTGMKWVNKNGKQNVRQIKKKKAFKQRQQKQNSRQT